MKIFVMKNMSQKLVKHVTLKGILTLYRLIVNFFFTLKQMFSWETFV